jgi:hypothetical protein
MRKIILAAIISIIVSSTFGQNEIKFIPFEIKPASKESNNEHQVFSKKQVNTVSIVVSPEDKDKEQKAQLEIVKLYDQNRKLLATSEPMDLHDWTVRTLGDDNTVLVIFPDGTNSKAIIKIYKKKGNKLTSVKTIERKASYVNFDIANNANYFICGFNTRNGESKYSEIVYYDSNGNIVQSYLVDEKVSYSIKITDNYIIATSHDLSNRTKFVYLFDHYGNRLMKKEIYEIVGNDVIETSDNDEITYFGISNLNTIQLFDTKLKKEIDVIKINDKGKRITSYVIDHQGILFATSTKRTYSKELKNYSYSGQELIVKSPDNPRQIIEIDYDGKPEVIIENGTLFLKMKKNNQVIGLFEIQY